MLQAQNITKKFDDTVALNNVSFSVNESDIFGFIGPDGAGKTTLFRIITTLLLADSGDVSLFGYDVVQDFKKIRTIIGYMPGRFSLYHDLTVEENLNFYASVFGTTVKENYNLIKDIYSHIEPFKKRLAGNLSGGMKQKLALSCALIHAPKLLVLDEPTTGVDAVSRTEFWQMLKNLQKRGITILVSTPYMDEAGQCDRVALIQNGVLLSINPPQQIIEQYDKKLWAIRATEKYTLIEGLQAFENIESVNAFGDAVHITTKNDELNKNALINFLSDRTRGNVTIRPIKPSIEDCFLRLMRKE
jgi:ABC-type multidrug transport system ATPase subunit